MKRIRSLLRGNIRQYAMVIALIVVVVIFEFLTKGVLLKPLNISNLIQQNAYVLILAIGMLLCILTIGNIDLSVGSVVGLVGALSAIFILKMNMPIWIAIILSLMAGFVIGAWQGLWIAYIGVPAFIVTLGGQLIFRGLTMVALQGTSLAPLPEGYTFLAAGFVPDIASKESTCSRCWLAVWPASCSSSTRSTREEANGNTTSTCPPSGRSCSSFLPSAA